MIFIKNSTINNATTTIYDFDLDNSPNITRACTSVANDESIYDNINNMNETRRSCFVDNDDQHGGKSMMQNDPQFDDSINDESAFLNQDQESVS